MRNARLFYLIIIYSTFFQSFVKNASIKLIEPNKLKNKPMKKSDFSFDSLDIKFEYINMRNTKYTKLVKRYLSHVSIIIGRLVYTKNFNKKIQYNKDTLRRFKIKLKGKDEKEFKDKVIETDLLLLVKLVSFKTLVVKHKLYTRNDEDDSADSRRTYIAQLSIKNDYEFNSKFAIDKFKLHIIREIFKILGFRKALFKEYFIRNNFLEIPTYLLEHTKPFQSFRKFLDLSDREFDGNKFTKDTKFYKSFWNDEYDIHDIMSDTLQNNTAITEITTNIMNEFYMYTINNCDLFRYRAGFGRKFSCLRPTQDCLDYTDLKNYFLEYNFHRKYEVICYLNTKENIKKNQCGIHYGGLSNKKYEYRFCPSYKQIKDTSLPLSMTKITELDAYSSQTIKLVKNSPSCPAGYPRTLFFSVPPSVFDEFKNQTDVNELISEINEINKDVEYEEVTFTQKDKKYFVTYEAYDDYYSRESVWKVLNYSGVIRSFSHFNTHNLLIKNPYKDDLEEMGMIPIFQKIFSYTNFKVISHKDLTYKNYYKMRQKFPKDFDYMPETFAYPEEKNIIENRFKDYKLNENDLWLIKPKTGSLGEGIYIFQNLTSTPDVYLISKYISNPHLINKLKYDFRVYVFITGLAPLKLYLYKEGMVRFATEEYTIDKNHITESYRHLTNVAINKKNTEEYKKAVDADSNEGSKWSLQVYEAYCKENGIDYQKIRNQMADIAIKSLLSVLDQFYDRIKEYGTKDRNHFKLFGFDFLLDDNYKVHLLEINDRPSLLMGDINDRKLKPQLVADCLNIVGITPYSHDYKDDFETWENKYYEQFGKEGPDELEDIINSSICELGRPRGRFDLIFPLKNNIDYYKNFFSKEYKENILFWKYISNNKNY
jgi:hypothetical protein